MQNMVSVFGTSYFLGINFLKINYKSFQRWVVFSSSNLLITDTIHRTDLDFMVFMVVLFLYKLW